MRAYETGLSDTARPTAKIDDMVELKGKSNRKVDYFHEERSRKFIDCSCKV
jgi:hypothetical protein